MDFVSETSYGLVELGLIFTRVSVASVICSMLALFAFFTAVLCYCYEPYCSVWRVPGPPVFPFVGHLPLLAKYGPDGPIFRDTRWSTMRNTILSVYQPLHLAKLVPVMQDYIRWTSAMFWLKRTVQMLMENSCH